jgi:hypothetical protein
MPGDLSVSIGFEFERMLRVWPETPIRPHRVEALVSCDLCCGTGGMLGEVICGHCDGVGTRWAPVHWVARQRMETRPERMLREQYEA